MPIPFKHEPAPYEKVSMPYGDTGQRREVARYRCMSCEATIDIPITPGNGISTQAHVKWMGQKKWAASSRNKVECPECSSKKEKPTVNTTNRMADDSEQPTVVQLQKTPTPDQRLAIRSALDMHFDDKDGVYLGNESDQTIAESMKIPRIWVETIREAAYGPIRVNPEVLALRKDIEAAAEAVKSTKAQADEAVNRSIALADTLKGLESRLASLAKKGRA